MALDQFEWREPPPPRTTRVSPETLALLAELQAHPGQWAIWKVSNTANFGENMRRQGVVGTARKRPDGRYDIWVSWPES